MRWEGLGCLPLSLFGEERRGWTSVPDKVSAVKAAMGAGGSPGGRLSQAPSSVPGTRSPHHALCLPFIPGVALGGKG